MLISKVVLELSSATTRAAERDEPVMGAESVDPDVGVTRADRCYNIRGPICEYDRDV